MLERKKIIATVAFVLAVPFFVSAQGATTTVTTAQKPVVQLVADVNLQDCTHIQTTSTNQGIHIFCNIINKLGNQGDIHYGVQLLKRATSTQEVMETKVYDKVLSVGAGQTISQQLEYVPPSYLSGQYELWGLLRTADGLPLSTSFLGRITLKATTASYLEIKSNTCSLRVTDDIAATMYNIQQGVDIDPSEVIEGICTVTAHAAGDTTATPAFVTYRGSVFGDVVPDTKNVQKSFTIKNNETKIISFVLPKASVPQRYATVLSLVSPTGIASNAVAIAYIIRGPNATIQNVLLDKDYYVAGDTARVSVFWTGSADSFVGARKPSTAIKATNLTISINDGSNNSCAVETIFAIPTDESERGAQTEYTLPVTHVCVDPRATIKIVDAAGVILAQKTVSFPSGQVPENVTGGSFLMQQSTLYVLAALVVVLLVGAILFAKKRNSML